MGEAPTCKGKKKNVSLNSDQGDVTGDVDSAKETLTFCFYFKIRGRLGQSVLERFHLESLIKSGTTLHPHPVRGIWAEGNFRSVSTGRNCSFVSRIPTVLSETSLFYDVRLD